MTKIEFVKAARKDQGSCEKCGTPLPAGSSYKHFSANRFDRKHVRCLDCPDWRPSEMTTSKISTAYAAQESAHDSLDQLEGAERSDYLCEDGIGDADAFTETIQGILNDCASGAQDCIDDYQEGLDNLPDGLREGPTAEETQEKIDTLEAWKEELESWSNSEDLDQGVEAEDADDTWNAWVEATIEEARGVVDGLEL